MSTEKYTDRIEIRLTLKEKIKVQLAAKKSLLSQTDYIRKCLGLDYDDRLERAEKARSANEHL